MEVVCWNRPSTFQSTCTFCFCVSCSTFFFWWIYVCIRSKFVLLWFLFWWFISEASKLCTERQICFVSRICDNTSFIINIIFLSCINSSPIDFIVVFIKTVCICSVGRYIGSWACPGSWWFGSALPNRTSLGGRNVPCLCHPVWKAPALWGYWALRMWLERLRNWIFMLLKLLLT